MGKISLKIVSPTGIVYSGEVDYVKVRTSQGEKGLLPGHENTILALLDGEILVKTGKEETHYHIIKGTLSMKENSMSILADIAGLPKDIPTLLEQREKLVEQSMLEESKSGLEFQRAEIALRRSLVRDANPVNLPYSNLEGEK